MLLDLHDDVEHDESLLHELLDNAGVPIIFNDVTALTLNEPRIIRKWQLNLMQKIAESTGTLGWKGELHSEPKPREYTVKPDPEKGAIAQSVWVLGSSLGGPEAVARFLAALPPDTPVAFILAQHLGSNFVHLLAEQLDRAANFNVMIPKEGHVLRHQQVVVAPVDERMLINPIGNIELYPLEKELRYSPSIDMVISDCAERYGTKSGAIIFSGMENDGVQGCQDMLVAGGKVWVQSDDSCVVSSMPDNVKKHCNVEFSGSPEELSRKLVGHLVTAKVEVV